MGLIADAYQRMLMALLPPGSLWLLDSDDLPSKLFTGCADELERFDARAKDLLNEAEPSTAVELLPEYERELDLVAAATDEERQARIVARLIARQRIRPVDFQTTLALLLGQDAQDVVVLERTAAMAASMGDVREKFRFFIYRDPTLPGTYYLESAQELVDTIKPSRSAGHVIESIDFLCDDAFSLCDRDLLGVETVVVVAPAVPTVTTNKLSYAVSEDITVNFSGVVSPTTTDWLTIVASGAGAGASGPYAYTNSGTTTPGGSTVTSGSWVRVGGMAAGTWVVRLLANDGFTLLDESPAFVVA